MFASSCPPPQSFQLEAISLFKACKCYNTKAHSDPKDTTYKFHQDEDGTFEVECTCMPKAPGIYSQTGFRLFGVDDKGKDWKETSSDLSHEVRIIEGWTKVPDEISLLGIRGEFGYEREATSSKKIVTLNQVTCIYRADSLDYSHIYLVPNISAAFDITKNDNGSLPGNWEVHKEEGHTFYLCKFGDHKALSDRLACPFEKQ